MSLYAGMVIALCALLRRFAGSRLPRRMYIMLWDAAVLRLLIPFALPWRFSPQVLARELAGAVKQAVSAAPAVREAALTSPPIAQETFVLPAQNAGETALPAAARGQAAAAFSFGLDQVLFAIWLAGVLAIGVWIVRSYIVSLRAFAQSLPDDDPRAARFLIEHPIRRHVRIRLSGRIASPLSYGVLRPVILLPKKMGAVDDRALSFVLMHEMEHIRALDAVRKAAMLLALCVHWFNPLVWIMFLLANRDMELRCDERVLRQFGRSARREYALTLLDMEERRCGLSPLASSFSMTAIEERIKTMKNMKKTGIASALAAALLVTGCAVALATDAPKDDDKAENLPVGLVQGTASDAGTKTTYTTVFESGDPTIEAQTYQEYYAKYAPFGLGYDAERERLTYDGKIVRYFEDMYPIDLQCTAGMVCSFPDGEVDVYAVRDLTGPIVRNADGSFDPSGTLTGLRAATQEEFDERTRELEEAEKHTQNVSTYVFSDAQQTDTPEAGGLVDAQDAAQEEIVWWTAQEYAEWLEQEKIALQELVDEGARAYTQSEGWFVWTQEMMDETLALYEGILEEIKAGAMVSKKVNGAEDVMLMMNSVDVMTDVETHMSTGVMMVSDGQENVTVMSMEETAPQQENTDLWENVLAPYEKVGLVWLREGDGVRMYVAGQEVRGIWDAEQGVWISQSMGLSRFDGDATEFIAVYEDGVLTGLRPANEQEKAFWDAQRAQANNP